jgi:hypothetical protein
MQEQPAKTIYLIRIAQFSNNFSSLNKRKEINPELIVFLLSFEPYSLLTLSLKLVNCITAITFCDVILDY